MYDIGTVLWSAESTGVGAGLSRIYHLKPDGMSSKDNESR